jgi:hypothetical protein
VRFALFLGVCCISGPATVSLQCGEQGRFTFLVTRMCTIRHNSRSALISEKFVFRCVCFFVLFRHASLLSGAVYNLACFIFPSCIGLLRAACAFLPSVFQMFLHDIKCKRERTSSVYCCKGGKLHSNTTSDFKEPRPSPDAALTTPRF